MAIYGLTTNATPTYPRLGQIRKGEKKANNRIGKNLNNEFRIVVRDGAIGVYEAMRHVAEQSGRIGEDGTLYVTSIRVFLPEFSGFEPTNDGYKEWVECVFPTSMMESTRSGVSIICDGKRITRKRTAIGMVDTDEPCKRSTEGCGCNGSGALLVVPAVLLESNTNYYGVFEVRTTSIYDLANVSGSLREIWQFGLQNNIPLHLIPLVLSRVKTNISTAGAGRGYGRKDEWLIALSMFTPFVRQVYARQVQTMQKHFALPDGMQVGLFDVDLLPGEGDMPAGLLSSGDGSDDEPDDPFGGVNPSSGPSVDNSTGTAEDNDGADVGGKKKPPAKKGNVAARMTQFFQRVQEELGIPLDLARQHLKVLGFTGYKAEAEGDMFDALSGYTPEGMIATLNMEIHNAGGPEKYYKHNRHLFNAVKKENNGAPLSLQVGRDNERWGKIHTLGLKHALGKIGAEADGQQQDE